MRSFDEAIRKPPTSLQAGVLPCLFFQTRVEFDAVFQHLRDVHRGTQLADQTRSMKGCSTGELSFIQKDDVLPSHLCQMVSNATTRNPTSDDHDPCLIFHSVISSYQVQSPPPPLVKGGGLIIVKALLPV